MSEQQEKNHKTARRITERKKMIIFFILFIPAANGTWFLTFHFYVMVAPAEWILSYKFLLTFFLSLFLVGNLCSCFVDWPPQFSCFVVLWPAKTPTWTLAAALLWHCYMFILWSNSTPKKKGSWIIRVFLSSDFPYTSFLFTTLNQWICLQRNKNRYFVMEIWVCFFLHFLSLCVSGGPHFRAPEPVDCISFKWTE